ncbi:MAG TPA: helix-turn-helix transcriptional regulator [Pseudonocardiaceae bacterium]|nr:helix-turn-helix transcriptional regulator [Pseudonocardiaceae bacterium]
MSSRDNELGEFLRSSRARLEPADAGLPGGAGARRVAGLRREEVAVLAGVSADYYARLEQGRERNPSAQVVKAIGRPLRLSADARGHLFRLAGLSPAMTDGGPTVHQSLARLIGSFPLAAAYVLGPAFDLLATNRIADALLTPFEPERNTVRILFTHSSARTVFVEWTNVVRATVHALRLNAGRFPGDQRIGALVEEMSERSPEFRALWEDRTVGGLTRAFKVFLHPEVGRIELTYQTFDITDAPGQQLLVGTPMPGESTAAVASLLDRPAADLRGMA